MISAEVIAEFDTPWIDNIISQYDRQLYDKIEALSSKKKVYTDLIWTKLFKNYRVSLLKIHDSQTIRDAIMHILTVTLDTDEVEIVDTLTDSYFPRRAGAEPRTAASTTLIPPPTLGVSSAHTPSSAGLPQDHLAR